MNVLLAEFERNHKTLLPFVVYMLGVMAIAYVAHRYQTRNVKKSRDFEAEYYVGSRSFGAWVLAMSWVATLASGGTFLGYPSYVYSYGWSMALWVSGSMVASLVGLGIVGKRINRIARQTGALTLVDLLRDRYKSQSLGTIYGMVIIAVTIVYCIAQFVAGGKILGFILGIEDSRWPLLIFAGTVVAYTTFGGFRAVAWTDTMQGIVMIVGVVLLVPLSIHAVGGLENATRNLMKWEDPIAKKRQLPQQKHAYLYLPGPEKIPKNAEQMLDEPAESVPWLPIGIGVSLFMLRSIGSIVMPTTVPRMLAFKDTASLRRALFLLAPYFLLMYGSSLIIMNCAASLDLGLGLDQSDQAVPAVASKVAPALLAGILIAAPFAAVMSTVDSALLVMSATVVRDFLQKSLWPTMKPETTKKLSYWITALVGLVVLVLAMQLDPAFLQPLVIHYVGASSSAFLWPSLTTLFWRRATAAGTIAGLVGGITVYALAVIFKPFSSLGLHPFIFGVAASGLLCVVVALLTAPQPSSRLELYFGRAPKK